MSDNSTFLLARLSKSGKALLLYDDRGFAYMTSVYMLKKLLDGKARSNNLFVNKIGEGNEQVPKMIANPKFNESRLSKTGFAGDTEAAIRERAQGTVKIKGDDW